MLKAIKFFFLPLIAMITFAVACNKATDVATEDLVDQALYTAQERGGMGRFGCYELVFPVTIVLPDSSTVEVDSYDTMKQTLRDYFEANGGGQGHGPHQGGPGNRPRISFVFPISVINEDGELITVNNEDELRDLRDACAGTFGNHDPKGHGQHGLKCFDLVFPVTIQFPDSTTAEAADRKAMRDLLRTWKQKNPTSTDRPQLVFPLTVKMDADGSLVTVNSADELHQLKEDCE